MTPGQFSVSGGIIDIFSLTEECPYRVELWGDDIDSIRSFDVESQRSMERVEEFVIYPSTEMVLDDVRISKGIAKLEKEHKAQAKLLKEQFHTEQYARLNKMVESVLEELKEFNSTMGLDSMVEYFYDDTVSFLDYFPTDTDIFIDDPERVNQRAGAYAMQFGMSMEGRLEGGYVLPTQANVLYDAKTVVARLVNRTPILLSELYKKQPAWKEQYAFQIDAKGLVSYNNSFEDLMKDIEKYKKKDYRILILSPSATRGKRIAKNLQDNDVMAYFTENREQPLKLRLYAAARILDFHDRQEMFGAIQNADAEFAAVLAAFVEMARPELERELGRGRCDALVRSEFRSLLCGYLRDDRPEDAALSRRLRRALSHLRVFSGVGARTDLYPAAPPVSMLLFPAVGRGPEFSPEAVAVFEMFFFGKLDSMHFCGTKIQRFAYMPG